MKSESSHRFMSIFEYACYLVCRKKWRIGSLGGFHHGVNGSGSAREISGGDLWRSVDHFWEGGGREDGVAV